MPTPNTCPRIWHCVFCGKYGPITDFQITLPYTTPLLRNTKEATIQACPQCKEYKGLEPCNPETCECWTLDVARKLAETDAIKKQLWKET